MFGIIIILRLLTVTTFSSLYKNLLIHLFLYARDNRGVTVGGVRRGKPMEAVCVCGCV